VSWEGDFLEWLRKRRRKYPFFRSRFFKDVDAMFKEIEELMERDLKVFKSKIPKEYIREKKLADGSKIRELGPFVFGYSMKIGSEGKPVVREFGNIQPSRFGPKVRGEREPLIDVFSGKDEVKIVAELPSVEKKDVKLHGTENMLTISVDTPQRKYYKEVRLPAKVDPKEARTECKNGVLEVTLKKKEEKKLKGELIDIE